MTNVDTCTCAYVAGDSTHEFHCEARVFECGWKCGDTKPDHKHYAVLVRENGKLLGRLTPQGTATSRNLFAAVFSKARAESIARDITESDNGGLTAKAIKF